MAGGIARRLRHLNACSIVFAALDRMPPAG
jgi:hypothetical protein